MPRLKRPLNHAAVVAADNDFYSQHPEMVVDGQRQPIDDNDPEQAPLRKLWIDLYLAHGGQIEDRGSSQDLDFQVQWLPDEKSNQFRDGSRKGKPLTAVKSHIYFVRAARLLVADQWPLSEYYVYIDTDLAETIDFDPLGLLWTDEKGFPHLCDSDGNPQERVAFFPFTYSTPADGTSCVLIYDTDLGRLKQKRAGLQGTNGKSSPHRVRELAFYDEGGGVSAAADIQVPVDNDVLPVDEIVSLVKKCSALLAEACTARDALKHFMETPPEHGVMWTSRAAIDGWLAVGDHRNYLVRLDGQHTMWDVACETFDKAFKTLTTAYENALQPLYDKISDSEVRRKLFLCGYVVDGWNDPKGYHGLWSCHFFIDAIGMFAGTLKHKEVFDNFVQPLLVGFAANWGQSRNKCKCPTCGDIEQVDDPLADVGPGEHFNKLKLKLKDGKIITSTIQRLADLTTKFIANFGLIIAMKEDFDDQAVSKIGFLGPNIFKRGGVVGKNIFRQFYESWKEHVVKIAKRSKDFQDHGKQLEDERKAIFQKYLKMDPGKVGNAMGMLGGMITVIYFFTKQGRETKDWVDLTKGATDILKGGVGLSKDKLAEMLAETYGKQAVKEFAEKLGKGLGVAGAALQLGSAYLNLDEATKKGDRQAFVWGAVQYMGADMYLTGVAVEFTPIFGVSQAAGVVVAVIGAVVYVSGQIGEFITRPGSEEKFLRGFYFYDDNDHRSPEEKEAEWQRIQAHQRELRMDRAWR